MFSDIIAIEIKYNYKKGCYEHEITGMRGYNMRILGMETYDFALWFFVFSFFGYILECIVVTLENRKLVVNRGFCHLPFCIIYGFGAVGAYLLLKPISDNLALLFLTSSALATTMEFVTGHAMIHLFGSFWWDYSKKSYNYKGMVCLESSIGWGILGIVFFYFLDGFMWSIIESIPKAPGKYLAVLLFIGYFIDFCYCLIKRIRNPEQNEEEMIGRRWVGRR